MTNSHSSYVAKYATKSEKQAPAFPQMLKGVVEHVDASVGVQTACQKLLNKMIGERTYSAQETAHLLQGIPLVRSSASFQTLNLARNGSLRRLGDVEGNEGEGDERPVTSESWLQRWLQFCLIPKDCI